jgi:DNA repair protein RadC
MVNETTVYPRELVKRAIELNSTSVIVAHNHPSGNTHSSSADRALTVKLRAALATMDIQLLDHFIVTPSEIVSMAERGEM